MSLPSALWAHDHITEREVAHRWPDGQWDDSHWEDCTWISGVEFARLTIRASIPSTHAEGEHLRDDAGLAPDGGVGSNDVALARGILKRYGRAVNPAVYGFDKLWAALKPGTVAVVAVSMGAFPYGSPLRRWDPAFHEAHRLLVAKLDSLDHVWWCDPLAPEGVGYQGQWVTKSQLRAAVNALPGRHIYGTIIKKPVPPPVITGDTMPTIATYIAGYRARVENAAGARVRSAPSTTSTTLRIVAAGKSETWTVVGWVKGALLAGSDRWLCRVDAGRWEYVHSSNVASVTAPADVTALNASIAALKAQIVTLTARLVGVKKKTAANAADIADD